MATQNTLANQTPKFSVMIQKDSYKNLINNTLGDPERAKRFIGAVSSAVAVNPDLQLCDAGTILSSALLGESLNLSPSPQLGQYYLIPFNDNKNNRMVAQFIIGYKGYIQLAIRSGQYKKLNAMSIKEGELFRFDPLEEEIEVSLIEDETAREKAKTIGYYAMFQYTNGFRKALYWSRAKMEAHALKYSKGYRKKTGYTFWEKDFDGMAVKTMLRQLISKWGILSVQMQSALESDMAVIRDGAPLEFVDNSDLEPIPAEAEESAAPDESEAGIRRETEADAPDSGPFAD